MEDSKVLITGASGLLGRQVFTAYKEAGWDVTGLCFSRPGEGLTQHDLSNKEATLDLIKNLQPSLVIHAAAQRFPDKLEHSFDESFHLNVTTTQYLAEATKQAGGRLVYISTDYVFDGETAPYSAEAETKPTNKYGETKLQGEKHVLEISPDNIVLRIPILYGPVKYLKESALTCLLETVSSGNPAKVSSFEVRCPAHTEDMAKIILDLGRKRCDGGIYQWCGLEKFSKWEIVQFIAQQLKLSMDHLEELSGPCPGVIRPRDVEMDRSKLENLGISHHRDFKSNYLALLKEWL